MNETQRATELEEIMQVIKAGTEAAVAAIKYELPVLKDAKNKAGAVIMGIVAELKSVDIATLSKSN